MGKKGKRKYTPFIDPRVPQKQPQSLFEKKQTTESDDEHYMNNLFRTLRGELVEGSVYIVKWDSRLRSFFYYNKEHPEVHIHIFQNERFHTPYRWQLTCIENSIVLDGTDGRGHFENYIKSDVKQLSTLGVWRVKGATCNKQIRVLTREWNILLEACMGNLIKQKKLDEEEE